MHSSYILACIDFDMCLMNVGALSSCHLLKPMQE